ncbi:response regulator receiver protein [Chondrocystis sp. NIES-4102]|nr:response regulator receiver protein [Chondrocystis sp. NIES-4102]
MIFASLNNLAQQSFTGIAHVRTKTVDARNHWKIYFNDGKILWADGGNHSHRSWQRHLNQYCSQVDLKQVNFRISESFRCSEYHSLGILLQRQLATPETIGKLITNKIIEIFFDLFQQEKATPLETEVEALSLSILIGEITGYSLITISIDTAFKHMQQQWSAWIQSGFNNVYPNYAPKIKSQEQLQQAVPAVVYQNFIKLLDGRRSLRDLAVGMNKDLLLLTKSLYPYVQKGLLELIEVPDINITAAANSTNKPATSQEKPIIACIDDSPQICQIMNQIITQANYRFLGIQQPIQAVPKLISVNPKMIFLDIGMPILNGYEVCTQIRRVSKLQEVPIIMLTGNDGVFDRVKAKVCGASDFLSKPIEIDKILQTIEKFSAPNAPKIMMSSQST